MQGGFGDIPLFRELQRLLASGEGPVNYEIARQVGGAVAAQAGAEPPITPETVRRFGESVHEAEALLTGFTRISLDEPVRADIVNRSWWVNTTLEGWRWVLNRLAERFTSELGRMGGEAGGEVPESGGGNPLEAAMGQIGPLLLGMQTGQLVGQLSTETLARYYFPIPREDEGSLFFVLPNLVRVGNDYGFDSDAFHRWMAAQEAARHLVFAGVPWVPRYYRSLLTDLVDAIEIDIGDLERRLMELQTRGVEALQDGAPDALPVVQTERHRRALERVRSFVALFEGYGSHSAAAVMSRLGSDDETNARIAEGVARHRASPSEGQTMLSSMLGISFDRALENSGGTFCAAVMELKGLGALNKVWDAPDNLPSPAELKDPFAWMDRALE